MSFKVHLTSFLRDRIARWNLPDPVLVDVYLRLQELADSPQQKLRRLKEPYDGMHFFLSSTIQQTA